jgi:hypothetical protein
MDAGEHKQPGRTLSRQGKCAEAEKMHRETLALKEKALGKGHPLTMASMSNLALILKAQSHNQEAILLLTTSLWLGEEILDPKHSNVQSSLKEWQIERK